MNIIAVFDGVTHPLRRRLSHGLLAWWTLAGLSALGAAAPLPVVTISSPITGARSNAPVAFRGTASESRGVITNVNYWITNLTASGAPVLSGQAALAAGAGAASNWTFTLSPLAGSNVLAVQSQDLSGNPSALVTRKFFVLSQAAFNVSVAGNVGGTVRGRSLIKYDTAPAPGAMLNIGEAYAITAIPANANTFFQCWTGAGLVPIGPTNTATLEFIMQPNTTLTANFITNLFLTRAGTYWGLFSDSTDNIGGPTEETAGMIANFVLNTRGFYSGSVYLGGSSPPISGTFTPDGYATNQIVITNLDGVVTVHLQLITNTIPPLITGSVIGTNAIILQNQTTQAGWTSSVTVLAPLTNTSNNAPAYTMLIESNPDPNSATVPPVGTGFAYLTNYGGAPAYGFPPMVTLTGLLGDWTSLSESAPINANNDFPIYQDYINTPNPGMLFGWLHFTPPSAAPATVPTLTVTNLTWIRKQVGRDFGLYTNGFTNHPIVQASYWSNAVQLTNFMPTNSPLVLSSPVLVHNPVTIPVTIDYGGFLVSTNTVLFSKIASINTNTGRFTFAFTNGYGVGHYAYGSLLQNTNTFATNGAGLGGGFFILGPTAIPTNIGTITWTPRH